MDQKQIKRQPSQSGRHLQDVENGVWQTMRRGGSDGDEQKTGMLGLGHPASAAGLLVLFLLFYVFAFVSIDDQWSSEIRFKQGLEDDLSATPDHTSQKDKLLGGLLADGFDEESCTSRYQSALYRETSSRTPSPYLIKTLRKYEDLHRRCGPNTELYNKAIDQLKSGKTFGKSECSYVINRPNCGLGNRMITFASIFLYAILTNRVLLTERANDMKDLFCEPFPQSSWFLPVDFPYSQLQGLHRESSMDFGSIMKSMFNGRNESLPAYSFVYLSHDRGEHDNHFFCDEGQQVLQRIPWLMLQSNLYFLPAFFLMPSYQGELNRLFPEKDAVFHLLGRYLFHPTNPVWGLITRYHSSYLAKADETIGIQIRVFDPAQSIFVNKKPTTSKVMEQILACSLKEKLLPSVTNHSEKQISIAATNTTAKGSSKAVLITSLNHKFSEMMKNMYWEQQTINGEVISVHQPSHEQQQKTEKSAHDVKAWAEMYLLSLSDELITTSFSTFGYVAQGLGGLRPWILSRPDRKEMVQELPCVRALSMEPCLHVVPSLGCRSKRQVDLGALVPHVRHCEDVSDGIKLV